MKRIFIAEDDCIICEELKKLLTSNGYLCVEELPCDLALVDINLPGQSGYALCKRIKEKSNVPVIFLTARDGADDELLGFGVGGDDYIRKPYNPDILLARIARLLRQVDVMTVNGITLDTRQFTVSFGGKSQILTKNELNILACLMSQKVCSKDEIITALWGNDCFIDENALYVNINRIRAKLKSIGCEDGIKTLRGAGYSI